MAELQKPVPNGPSRRSIPATVLGDEDLTLAEVRLHVMESLIAGKHPEAFATLRQRLGGLPQYSWLVDAIDNKKSADAAAAIAAAFRLNSFTSDGALLRAANPSLVSVAPSVYEVCEGDGRPVTGMTLCNDRLYVVRLPTRQRVSVYDVTSPSQLSHTIKIPQLGSDSLGVAACDVNNCLYVSDWYKEKIHKVSLSSSPELSCDIGEECVTSWTTTTGNQPLGLSVSSASHNLIVVCWPLSSPDKLIEFTSDGVPVREILLHPDIAYPQHAIELADGHFVVTYGAPCQTKHGVCIVGPDGETITDYGQENAGTDPSPLVAAAGRLDNPKHLAVDGKSSTNSYVIILADKGNNRLVALDGSLKWSRTLGVPAGCSLKQPFGLCVDESRGFVYVGEHAGQCRLLRFAL